MSNALDRLEQHTKQVLKDLLSQCTEKQQAFFARLYPEGIDDMEKNKINIAIQQCENSIRKNKNEFK